MAEPVRQRFTAALDSLIEVVKRDRSILAAVLCGSLSHDTVWAKSDIDLVLITIDDKLVKVGDLALYADGVNVHALLFPRSQLRQSVEGARRSSFMHSFLAKGKLLYTHDETIPRLLDGLKALGERDMQIEMLNAATDALPAVYKAHKWMVTRGDLDYTALWILHAANSLARLEIIGARQLPDREVLPQALKLNPEFFDRIYVQLLNAPKTGAAVTAALEAIDQYLARRARQIFALVLRYLREAGEARSSSEIDDHFKRHFDIRGVLTACEYLADQELIGKASLPVHLTKKSNVETQEMAFFDLDGGPAWDER